MSVTWWPARRRARGGQPGAPKQNLGVALGIFGKLPRRPDFVRAGLAWPAFEGWLQGELEALGARGEDLGDEWLRVFLPALNGGEAWALLVSSRDAVGRRFPLALFCRRGPAVLGGAGLVQRWAQRARFFASARATLAQIQADQADQADNERGDSEAGAANLAARLSGVDKADSDGPVEGLGTEAESIDMPVSLAARATFAAACRAGGRTPPLTVEAPAPHEGARTRWLSLAETHGPQRCPAVLAGPQRLVLGYTAGQDVAPVLAAYGLGPRAGARHWMVLPDLAALERG